MIDPALVYTMELYEDKLCPSTYELAIGMFRYSLGRILVGGTKKPQCITSMGQVGFQPHSRQYIFNTINKAVHGLMALIHEAIINARLQQLSQWLIKPSLVNHNDGRQIQTQPLESHDFQQFFEGAAAPRQCNHCISIGKQARFALGHVGGPFIGADIGMRPFKLAHEVRHDSRYGTAGGMDPIRKATH
jgi:hypothetical protein